MSLTVSSFKRQIGILMVLSVQQQKAIQRGLTQFYPIPLVRQRRIRLEEIHRHFSQSCKCGSISTQNCVIPYAVLRSGIWFSLLTGKGSNTSTPTMRQEAGTPDWTVADVQEFVPSGFEGAHVVSGRAFHLCTWATPALRNQNHRFARLPRVTHARC